MHRRTLIAGLLVLTLGVSATAAAATPKLVGTVGPGFTITLKQNGRKVTKLKPGRYLFVVTDRSSSHNFELEGPGVKNVETDVSATGTKRFRVTLKKGTYTFYCKPHESSMHGSFKVA